MLILFPWRTWPNMYMRNTCSAQTFWRHLLPSSQSSFLISSGYWYLLLLHLFDANDLLKSHHSNSALSTWSLEKANFSKKTAYTRVCDQNFQAWRSTFETKSCICCSDYPAQFFKVALFAYFNALVYQQIVNDSFWAYIGRLQFTNSSSNRKPIKFMYFA